MQSPLSSAHPSTSALRTWLRGPAATIWLDRGVDRTHGGYFDQLGFDTAENACDYKRLRVCTRQIYVFSQMAEWGIAGAGEAAQHGLDFLFGRMRHAEGGFVRSVTLTGAPLDPTRDLYDHAFVLFALAAAYARHRDTALREEAEAVVRLIQTMADPAGGFVEALPPALPRRQNPHMHLLEACLAWLPLAADDTFANLAGTLLDLFSRTFWDAPLGILREFFGADWSAPTDPAEAQFEPGHHCEWIWLLGEASRAGLIVPAAKRQLAATVRQHGFDPATGMPYGAVRADGIVTDGTCRIWVLTEWLRAALVEPESGLGTAEPAIAQLLARFDVPVSGLWYERGDARSGHLAPVPVPASSLYHIVSGLTPIMDAPVAIAGARRD